MYRRVGTRIHTEAYKYSDATVLADPTILLRGDPNGRSLVGETYPQRRLLRYLLGESIRTLWSPGESSHPVGSNGSAATSSEYPSLGNGGHAFGSIPEFNARVATIFSGVELPMGISALYARLGSAQHVLLGKVISYLERVPFGFVTSSGMSAINLALEFGLPKGGTILHSAPIYDCTRSAFETVYRNRDYHPIEANFYDLAELEKAIIAKKPDKLFFETPANPTMDMIDIKGVYALAQKYKAVFDKDGNMISGFIREIVIDNTFASPIIQKPIEIVDGNPDNLVRIIHSGTKHFTGGLDPLCWGYVSLRHWGELVPMLVEYKDTGVNMSTADAAAVLHHGIPTLWTRVIDASSNALTFAHFLNEHPAIAKVNYPGLPPFKTKADQMFTGNGYGSVLHCDLDPKQYSEADVEAFLDILALQSFAHLAVSLGKVSTLFESSWFMVHRFKPEADKRAAGITPHGVRWAIGNENVDDLIHDVSEALRLAKDPIFRKDFDRAKRREKIRTAVGHYLDPNIPRAVVHKEFAALVPGEGRVARLLRMFVNPQ